MAGDSTTFPLSTCMTLFFSLLLFSHFTMAVLDHSFSPKEGGAKKRNSSIVAASARAQNSKKDHIALGETEKGIHVSRRPKRGRSRRSPLQWENRVFNASAHEVPSGPNPISNR